MKRNCVLLLTVLCAVGIISGAISAAVPLLLTHQGRLLDATDSPVTGSRDITFRIYETETGGAPLWTETHTAVPINDGLYSVILGSSITISGDLVVTSGTLGTERFLEIEVDADGPMSPRKRLTSAAYAVASSRVSGDVETHPGELSLSGMSGSTTATIRSSSNPGDPGSAVELVDGNGSTTGTIRAASSTGAQVHLSGHGGSTTGTIRMQASPDSAVSTAGLDLNGDGVPDVATAMEAIESRNILKSYFETGDKPSQAQFITQYSESNMELSVTEVDELHTAKVSADSMGSELRVLNMPLGGGISGSTTGTIRAASGTGAQVHLSGMSGSTTGTIRMVAHQDSAVTTMETDADGDGASEKSIRLKILDASSQIDLNNRFGSGPRQSTSLDGSYSHASSRIITDLTDDGIPDLACVSLTDSGSASTVVAADIDGDGNADARANIAATMNGNTVIGCARDIDDDGVDDNEAEISCDATSARSIFEGRGGSTTGTIRIMASPDSTVAVSEMSDGSSSSSSNMRTRINDLENKLQSIGLLGTARILTKTSPVSASDECRWVQDDTPDGESVYMATTCDSTGTSSVWSQNDDADDFPNIKVRVELKDEFGNSRGGMYLDNDSDNDGVSDVSAELVVDEDSASFRLNGLPPGVPVIESISMKATPTSVYMAVGAATCDGTDWINASDVNSKENFEDVDGEEILDKISDLEITRWNYKGKNDVEHIGPTAQDFHKAFGVGPDDKSISTIDPSGIALAAIKELNKQNQELAKQNDQLKKELENLKKKVDKLVSNR